MAKGLVLSVCLLVVLVQVVYGSYYSDLQCHKCKKAPNHDACNKGIEVCKKDYTACITKTEEKKGKIEITKGCSKPKYCKDPQPNCDKKKKKCSWCCYDDMCNVGDWPPPDNSDPCGCKPCLNGGTCEKNGNKFKCRCPPGFTGRYCETVVDKPDPCKCKPCKNGGTCWSCNGNWYCNCPPAFTGERCETPVDPCKPENPCMNGGQCKPDGNGDYTCRCKPGFTGEHCEDEITPCASRPCKNGGTCQEHACGFTCICPPGFTGKNCENEIPGGCFRCPKPNGLFPDRFNCRKFYHCSNYIPYHKDCPAQLHYNTKKKECDWPADANCKPHSASDGDALGSCSIDQEEKRDLEEESAEDTFVWEEDVEEQLDHSKPPEDTEERSEEDSEEEEERIESAREFIEDNEAKIDSILSALQEIEEEIRNRN